MTDDDHGQEDDTRADRGADHRADPEGVRIIGADEASEVLERDDVATRRDPDDPGPDERSEPPSEPDEPMLRFPLSTSQDDGGSELPHWTEPPRTQEGSTIFDDPAAGADWAGASASPRWRDGEGEEWAEDDVRALGDDERLGALDDDRPDPEDFFRFDDIEERPARSVFDDSQDDGGQYDRAPVEGQYEGAAAAAPPDDGPRRIVVGGGPPQSEPPGYGGTAVGSDRDLGQAAVVGVGFLIVAAVLFALGPVTAAALVAAVVTFAAAEFLTKLREVGFEPPVLIGVAATFGMVVGAYHRGEAAIPVVLVLAVAFAMLWYLFGAGEGQATLNIGVTLLAVGWIGMFGSFATALLAIQGGPGIGDAGKGILFGAILATVGYDVGGYFVGRSTGRSPLSQASPNKTVEGLLGGCVAALTVAVIYGFLSEPFGSLGDGLTLGIAVAVAAPLGDLCQSKIKRDLGIKDMGTVLPGHGGFMDRFDALLFVLPAVYYAARLSDFFL